MNIPLESFSLEYPNMRAGRFTLQAGEEIPIHIHENQFGFAYLLSGKCQITTYVVEEIENELMLLTLDMKQELIAHNYSVLTPKINAHQIYAVEDTTFLDIFAPGSPRGELTTYLDIISSEKNNTQLVGKKISIAEVTLPASLVDIKDSYTKIM